MNRHDITTLMNDGFGGISYDIGAKSRFLLMIQYVGALNVFFNVGYFFGCKGLRSHLRMDKK